MYELFEKLLNERGLKASDVAKATGLSSTFFSEWKKGKSKVPKFTNLQKIATFFEVPVEYFSEGNYKTYETPPYSDEYFELISLYSQLTDIQKETVINMLRSFVSEK